MQNHKKRVALVTGGNRGIGFEFVRRYLERKDTVFATFENHKRGDFAPYVLRSDDGGFVFQGQDPLSFTDVEAAANDISRAARETAANEEAQKAKAEAYKTAVAAKQAGQEVMDDVKPHLLAAFRKIRSELDQVIGSMEASEKEKPPAESTQE